VWIHGNTKGGFLSISRMCLGYPWYVSGSQGNESTFLQLNIFSEADIESVVLGANPYDILPIPYEFTGLPFDYSTMVSVPRANISSITAPTGQDQTAAHPATVVTLTPHGCSVNDLVFLHNTGVDEFDNAWIAYEVDSPTQLKIGDNNHTNKFWSGASASAGSLKVTATGMATMFGLAYDSLTRLVHMGWVNNIGPTGMVSVFEYVE